MQGKKILVSVLVILAAVAGYLIFVRVQKYRTLKTATIGAVLECKENLNFLYECESYIGQTGDEISGLVKAQAGTQRTLKDRDLKSLLNAGINDEKKHAISRLTDNIVSYNALLANAFYSYRNRKYRVTGKTCDDRGDDKGNF